ncbi:MAG TPA: HIT domain-containing protein [Tepidisphaeraceae bacterium]|jgi:ATP adenylyltransferase|nr:HIT domain-containing protein [Tepidisphaeraceae bacterium]
MDSGALYAPWRMDYIRSLHKPGSDACFICEAAAATTDEQRRQRLALWTTPHAVVLLNRYPYANGHLLVAPRAHKADPEELTADEHLDLAQQVTACVKLLKRAVSAQGFNLGVNLGRCAGAGVPGHLHHHVVPRWAGDVNFMGVVGEVKVIPEAISRLYTELIRVRTEMGGCET